MRYKTYKEVDLPWLGEVPEHWEMNVAKYYIKTKKELNKNKLIDNVLSLTLNGVVRNDKEKPIGLVPADYSTYQIFEKNNLVFKLIDLNNIKTSRVGLVPEIGIMSSAYIRGIIEQEKINCKYIYYWYFKLYLEEVYNKIGSGVRSTLTANELFNLPIPIPPKEEQEQIARFLDWKINEIDRLIVNYKKRIDFIELIKGNLISNEYNVTQDKIRLKRLLTKSMEYGLNMSGNLLGDFRYIRITDIDENGNLKNDNKQYVSNIDKRYLLKYGDILFARSGATVGKTFIYKDLNEESAYAGYLIRARLNKDIVYPEYIYYFTQSNDYEIWKNTIFIQSTIQNINAEKYSNLLIPFISKEKQLETIKRCKLIIEKTNTILKNYSSQIEKLKLLKESLISDVVTGKIDVRNVEIPDYEEVKIEEIEELEEEVSYGN